MPSWTRPATSPGTPGPSPPSPTWRWSGRGPPGVYRLEFTLVGEGPAETRKEVRAYSFNVDAEAESDLSRADRDRLAFEIPKKDSRTASLMLSVPGDENMDRFRERQPDAS